MASLGPWRADRRIAVAVSGGADSLCLAWLAGRWGAANALVVDHGLRAGSAADAATTLRTLAELGMASHLLCLHGLRSGPALAARARAARYARLLETCAALGLTDLLVGHHRGDQAETVLMRSARPAPADAAGRAGISRIIFADAARILRPLLDIPPARLRATLAAAGLRWIEDPSNADRRAERARARARLAAWGDDDALRLIDAAARLAALRAAREHDTAAWLAAHATLRPEGFALIPAAPLPPAALASLLRVVGGAEHAPARDAVRRLAAAPAPATLGGVRLMPAGRLGPGLLLVREAAAIAPAMPAIDGARWDGRYRLTGPAAMLAGLSIGPLGGPLGGPLRGALGGDAAALRTVAHQAAGLPAAVLRTLPALRRADMLVAVPQIGYYHDSGLASLSLRFAPPAPAAGAAFTGMVEPFVEGVPKGLSDPTSRLDGSSGCVGARRPELKLTRSDWKT